MLGLTLDILRAAGFNVSGGGGGPTPLLDTYTGASAAFSVRLLRTAYTGDCMRVRRASDNVEADVGFDAGELKLTSPISNTSDAQSYTDFADFVDHTGTPTDAFCRYWYDQSGNSNDAGTATQPNQPKLYDATTGFIEEGSVGNKKPALDFDGSNDKLQFPSTVDANFYYGIFIVRSGSTGIFLGSLDTNEYWMDIGSGGTGTGLQYGFNGVSDPSDYSIFRKNGATAFTTTTTRNDYKTAFYDGSQVLMSAITDGTAVTFGNFNNFNLGSYTAGGFAFNGNAQEFIMYQSTISSQSSIASGVENNINGFFKIY